MVGRAHPRSHELPWFARGYAAFGIAFRICSELVMEVVWKQTTPCGETD